MDTFSVVSSGAADTSRLAATIAPILRFGDAVILTGSLAAGKTHFVKALANALGCTDLVTSPTFTIANFYRHGSGNLLHIDVYRLSGLDEFLDLGLDECFSESITVVEWGDMVAGEFADYLSVKFDFLERDENQRKVTFSFVGERWASEMALLKNKLSGF